MSLKVSGTNETIPNRVMNIILRIALTIVVASCFRLGWLLSIHHRYQRELHEVMRKLMLVPW